MQPTAVVLAEPGGLHYLAAVLTLVYLLIIYGRLSETFLRIPLIAFVIAVPALLVTFLAGGLFRTVTTRPGILLTLLTCWLIICIPFSEWPGGSFQLVVKNLWLKSVAVFFLVAANIVTFKLFRRLIYVINVALLLILLASAASGISRGGRFALGAGLLTNPNDLATHVLLGVPFLFFVIETKTLKSFKAWISLAIACGVVLMVLKTGSRAGLLTLIGLIGLKFLRGSIATKALLMVASLIALLLAPFLVPIEVRERYLTLFSDVVSSQSSSRQVEFAKASAESRMNLLKQSIEVMITHPIFGVGPGMFSVATADKMQAEGERAHWQQTHNSFTQMASEGGLPAGLLYLALVWFTVRTGFAIQKFARQNRAHTELAAAADCLITSVVCFAVSACFGNYAYMVYMPMLAGFGEALRGIAIRELQTASPPQTTTPAWGVPRPMRAPL